MELRAGYKNTEVGVIPSDWGIVLLNELATKIGSGITPTGGSTVYKKDGRPLVRSQNIGWGNLLLDDIAFIDDETHETFPNTEIQLDDVFLNISGASIGRSSFANENLVGGNVNQHVCIIRVFDKKISPLFLNLFLLSKNGQKQIDSFQSGGNRQGLNIAQIKTFQIPLPPTLEEQTAIATALSDADALISSLEKLLTKKRNIKQGAMQRLLEPKEGWEVKRLGEVVKISSGESPSKFEFVENGIPYFKVEQLNNGFIYADQTEYFIKHDNPVPTGSIIFPKRGASIFLNKIRILRKPSYMDTNLMAITPCNEISNMYLFFALTNIGLDQVADTTSIPQINNKHIMPFELSFPNTKKEQIRIATILSDMDAEITALETKLEKYRKIKLGMMQNLLTGKIRLV